jgi:hypothetical protein
MKKYGAIIDVVLKAVGMAMGIATVVMSILGVATAETMIMLLGIAVTCLGLTALSNINEDELDKL